MNEILVIITGYLQVTLAHLYVILISGEYSLRRKVGIRSDGDERSVLALSSEFLSAYPARYFLCGKERETKKNMYPT